MSYFYVFILKMYPFTSNLNSEMTHRRIISWRPLCPHVLFIPYSSRKWWNCFLFILCRCIPAISNTFKQKINLFFFLVVFISSICLYLTNLQHCPELRFQQRNSWFWWRYKSFFFWDLVPGTVVIFVPSRNIGPCCSQQSQNRWTFWALEKYISIYLFKQYWVNS